MWVILPDSTALYMRKPERVAEFCGDNFENQGFLEISYLY